MFKKPLIVLLGLILAFGSTYLMLREREAAAEMGDMAVLGWDFTQEADAWRVNENGHLIPGTANVYDVGIAGYELNCVRANAFTMGGVTKTGWGSVVSPMTDYTGYVTSTDSGTKIKLMDVGNIIIGGGAGADVGIIFDNDAQDYALGIDDNVGLELTLGNSLGTTPVLRIGLAGNIMPLYTMQFITTPELIFGNAEAEDIEIKFMGNAFNMWLSMDDSEDRLALGTGLTTNGTILMYWDGTNATTIMNQDAANTTLSDLLVLKKDCTAPTTGSGIGISFVIEDAGNVSEERASIDVVFTDATNNGSEVDFVFSQAITETVTERVRFDADGPAIHVKGATPNMTIGDGGTEDTWLIFDGDGSDYSIGFDDTGTPADAFVIAGGPSFDNIFLAIATNGDIHKKLGDLLFADDLVLRFGTGNDWSVEYDEANDDQLIFLTAGTNTCSADTDAMFGIYTGATMDADQQLFAVCNGTQSTFTTQFSVDEDGDVVLLGNTTIGKGAAADVAYRIDANVYDWAIGVDDSADDFTITIGTTLGTDSRITINGDTNITTVTLGDAAASDTILAYDGNAFDYYIALDDGTDDLMIGTGGTIGTNEVIIISNDHTVTFNNEDATNEAVEDLLVLQKTTDQTFTAGIGVGVSFVIEDAGSAAGEEQASLDIVMTCTTDALEDADFVLSQNVNGTISETLRLKANMSATDSGALQYTAYTMETDAVEDVLILKLDHLNNPTDNFGLGISFQSDDKTNTTVEEQASIHVSLASSVALKEDSAMIFNLQSNGTIREVLRIQGNAETDGTDVLKLTSSTFEDNAVVDLLILTLDDLGNSPQNSFGMGISFQMDDMTNTAIEEQASIDVVLMQANSTNEVSDFIISTQDDGAITETLRIEGLTNLVKTPYALSSTALDIVMFPYQDMDLDDTEEYALTQADVKNGWGMARLGNADVQYYAHFSFGSDGAPLIWSNSSNFATSDGNDTTFNIYDNGSHIVFENQLADNLILELTVWYAN